MQIAHDPARQSHAATPRPPLTPPVPPDHLTPPHRAPARAPIRPPLIHPRTPEDGQTVQTPEDGMAQPARRAHGLRRALTHLPRNGRRHQVLRALRAAILTPSEVCRITRDHAPPGLYGRIGDDSEHRIRTVKAMRGLRRDGMLARTPWGWTITVAGLALLAATEAQG